MLRLICFGNFDAFRNLPPRDENFFRRLTLNHSEDLKNFNSFIGSSDSSTHSLRRLWSWIGLLIICGVFSGSCSRQERPAPFVHESTTVDGRVVKLQITSHKLATGDGFVASIDELPIVASAEAQNVLAGFGSFLTADVIVAGPDLEISVVPVSNPASPVRLLVTHRFIREITHVDEQGKPRTQLFKPGAMPISVNKS